jgi:hypothetical protein
MHELRILFKNFFNKKIISLKKWVFSLLSASGVIQTRRGQKTQNEK